MAVQNKFKSFVSYSFWVLGVWALLVAAYAAWMYKVSTGPAPVPELGYTAGFIFFVVCYSIPYFIVAFAIYGLATLSSTPNHDDNH